MYTTPYADIIYLFISTTFSEGYDIYDPLITVGPTALESNETVCADITATIMNGGNLTYFCDTRITGRYVRITSRQASSIIGFYSVNIYGWFI